MKKIALTSLLVILTATAASAAITPYTSLKLGYVDIDTIDVKSNGTTIADFDGMNGFTGAIAAGANYDVANMVGIRGELEYTYLDTKQDKDNDPMKLSYHNFMVNGYADFGDASWMVRPYVGLGVGYTFGQLSTNALKQDISGMAYAVSGGITYAVSSNIIMDLGAKYTMQDLVWDEHKSLAFDMPALSFLLGARYMF